MKKLIILAVMLMAVSVNAENSKYGSMWKQNDSTVSPADDVVYVDFTGYTTVGLGDGSADFSNITSQMNITFDATENMSIDAATTNHTGTDGVIDIMLTPSAPSTRGTQVTIDANGQNDTMGHNVTYTANGMETGDVGMAMEININPGTSTGGEVEGLRITRTGVGGVEVNAIHVGTRVSPIHQSSGTPENMDIAFLNNSGVFVNATTAFRNDSSTLNYALVPNTNDYIYIGHASIFSDVEIVFETNADISIAPVFEYYTGGWTVFGPNDSTAGLTTDGAWSWDTLSNWVVTTVNGVTNKYWIRVQRTSTVTTDAVEKTINIVIPTEYSWGENGDLTAYDLMMEGTFGAGPALDVSGAGTRCFFYPKKAAWRCGAAVSTEWDDANIGFYSYAEGSGNESSANQSHAEGLNTTAISTASHAEGGGTLASGAWAHAEGLDTIASNTAAHAEGNTTIASGLASHARGNGSIASGLISSAAGFHAEARADFSFAFGEWITIDAAATNSVLFGSFGNLSTPDTMKLANMNLIVDGGVAYPNITTVFSNYSVNINDKYVFINASAASRTLYLPDATLKKGAEIRYKKVDTLFNSVTFDGYGNQTINNNLTLTKTYPGNALTMLSDGSNWQTTQETGEALVFSSFDFSTGAAGTYYSGGGFYHGDSADVNLTQASTSFIHGTANEPSGAHIFWVFGGYTATPDGTVFLNVSGTSVADSGVAINEEVTLVSDMSALSLDDYVETTQKWIGQVTYKLGCTGTCTTFSADGNTGHAKYADFQDRDFTLRAFEATGEGGSTDTGFDLCIKLHDHTGWTYAATGFVPGNGDIACLGTDYGVNDDLAAGSLISWDRDLNVFVSGSTSQGLVIEVTTSQNNSVRSLNMKYGIVYK